MLPSMQMGHAWKAETHSMMTLLSRLATRGGQVLGPIFHVRWSMTDSAFSFSHRFDDHLYDWKFRSI